MKTLSVLVQTAFLILFATLTTLCKATLIDASAYGSVDAAWSAFLSSGTATGIYFPARTTPYVINSPPLSFSGTPKSCTLQGDSATGYTPTDDSASTVGSRIRVTGTSGPGFSLSFSNYSQTFTMDSLEIYTDYSGGSPVASQGGLNIDYTSAGGTASGTTVSITRSRFTFPEMNSSAAMVALTEVCNATITTTALNGEGGFTTTTDNGAALRLLHGCNTVCITQCSGNGFTTGIDIDSSSGSLYAIYILDSTFINMDCGLNAHVTLRPPA